MKLVFALALTSLLAADAAAFCVANVTNKKVQVHAIDSRPECRVGDDSYDFLACQKAREKVFKKVLEKGDEKCCEVANTDCNSAGTARTKLTFVAETAFSGESQHACSVRTKAGSNLKLKVFSPYTEGDIHRGMEAYDKVTKDIERRAKNNKGMKSLQEKVQRRKDNREAHRKMLAKKAKCTWKK